MESVYTDPSHPAAYGGVSVLARAAGKRKPSVEKFLRKNDTYRKFFRNKTKFDRARTLVSSVGHIFQADLFDMQKFSRKNRGYRYILVVVDSFSRYLKARPLKTKTAVHVAESLREIFQELCNEELIAKKVMLATDLGTEFWNREADKVYDQYDIAHFALKAPKKCSIAEISGRYLLDRIYKHMHNIGSDKWIDDLQKFVSAKNKRRSKTLGNMAPEDVTYENQDKVYQALYAKEKNKKGQIPLKVGTKVQMALDRLPFHKSFHGYFTDKVYEIKHYVSYNNIYRYTLIDTADNMEISGTYYMQELLPFDS